MAALNLVGNALQPGAQRSWWLREALAREEHVAATPLAGDVTADVAIVGGGFTGLWTAYFLTQANPGLGVAVVVIARPQTRQRVAFSLRRVPQVGQTFWVVVTFSAVIGFVSRGIPPARGIIP